MYSYIYIYFFPLPLSPFLSLTNTVQRDDDAEELMTRIAETILATPGDWSKRIVMGCWEVRFLQYGLTIFFVQMFFKSHSFFNGALKC